MSIWDFIGGFANTMKSQIDRAEEAALEERRQKMQLDMIEAAARIQAKVENDYAAPQQRQYRDDKTGGLMAVNSKWDPERQEFKDYGAPSEVRPTVERVIQTRQGDEKVDFAAMSDGAMQEIGRGNAFSPRQRDTTPRASADTSHRRATLEANARRDAGKDARDVRSLRGKARDDFLAPYGGSIDEFEKARVAFYMGGGENPATETPRTARDKPKMDQAELQEAMQQARAAIARGAPKDAVLARLREAFPGIDLGGL